MKRTRIRSTFITVSAFCCAALLAISPVHAGDILTINAPQKRQVYQRNNHNEAKITINGEINGTAGIIEARADLPGETKNGTARGWTTIAKQNEIDTGHFTGQVTLQAGGWYILTIRARRAQDVVDEDKVMKVGVGDVFVTAGQSNSANFGKPKQEAEDDRVVYFNGKHFVPAKDPIPGGCGDGGSPWPMLGDLIARSQQVPVCFRSASLTWTEVKNWMPGVKHNNHMLYDNLVKCIRAFPKGGVRAVLWHQGESDSLAGTSAKTYFKRLKTIINALNEDSGYVIPWFVAQASFHPEANATQEEEVANGQRRLWEKGVAHRGPNTDELGQSYRHDRVHFNQKGLTTHARRWFKALAAKYNWATDSSNK